MKKLKRFKIIIAFLCFIAVIITCFGTTLVNATGSFPDVSGVDKVYLYNFESGKVVYSKGSQTASIAPASTVKIMSGLLAIEQLNGRLDENITVTSDMLYNVEGFTVNLKEGDILTVKDLLYCLICGGGNDAAIILAIVCSGSIESFVEQMNRTASSYGMSNTKYSNPTGIDTDGMTTTINDTVILSQKAIENELFVEISSTRSYTYKLGGSSETRTVVNRNPLISNFSASGYQNKNVKGLNAGMTDNGGYCVSAYASNGKDSYLCIIMGGTLTMNGRITSYSVANSLLSHVFKNYTYTKIAEKGSIIGALTVDLALPVNGSQAVTVNCVLENDVYGYAPCNIDYKRDLTYKTYYHSDPLTAPVNKNTIVGGVDIYYQNEYIATARLITDSDVVESDLLIALDKMKSITLSRPVFIFLVLAILLILLYLYLTVWKSKLRKRRAIENEKNNKKIR